MDRKMQPLLLSGLIASGYLIAAPQTFAALPSTGAGYVHDSSGIVVRSSNGDCVRTSHWSPEAATAQCDPGLVQRDAAVASSEPVAVGTSEIAASEPQKEEINIAEKALFDFDRAELRHEDRQRLDEVISQMGNIPEDATIQITGYTDSIGSEEYNLALSMRRAQAAQEYLVDKGIDRRRIVIAGMGTSNPVASNATAEGRAMNRRAEIEIQVG
ncbi:MAG: OmpA family protein [Sulfuricaulis sp.]